MNSSTFFRKLLLYVPVKLVPAFLGIYFIFLLFSVFPEGGYVNYSVGVVSSLIVAQLSTGWIGTSYIYYAVGKKNQATFFYNCLWILIVIAPAAALVAGLVATFFVDGAVFFSVSLLCFSQILFFFLSAVFQAEFLVKHQLVAVLIQAIGQVTAVLFLFEFVSVDFNFAIASLTIGYICAASFLLLIKIKEYGISEIRVQKKLVVETFSAIYRYGSAMSPWMLGMLIMTAVDRFAIGYYKPVGGDAYLSLKDLFVGGAGLLSMPLLMMVHSLLIQRFKEGRFAADIIQASVSFLVISFTGLWVFLHFLGLELFELMTDKPLGITRGAVFLAFLAVFLASVSIYAQKRLEVHRKIGRLAFISLICAVISIPMGFAAGASGGILGIAIAAVAAQLLYLVMLMKSFQKKINVMFFLKPVLWALSLFGCGDILSYTLEHVSAENAIGYWQVNLVWFAAFSLFVLLALWKGVNWAVFMQRSNHTGTVKRAII